MNSFPSSTLIGLFANEKEPLEKIMTLYQSASVSESCPLVFVQCVLCAVPEIHQYLIIHRWNYPDKPFYTTKEVWSVESMRNKMR